MQTRQVLGVHGGGMLYASKSAPAKTSDGSFDQLIQMSQNAGSAEEQVQKPVENTKKEPVAEVKKAEQPEKPAEATSEKTDASATAEEKTTLGKAENTEEASDVEAAERAAGILAQVTEVVKDILGLTEEQLNAFMEELGITSLDLLQPETLQNLVLMANSEQDAVVLLTDAELLTTVNQLTEQVEQVLAKANVTPEELIAAMEDTDFSEMVAEAMEQLGEEDAVNTEETSNSTEVEHTVEVQNVETQETEKVEIQTDDKGPETSSKDAKQDTSTEVDIFANQFVQNLQQAAEEVSEITGQKDLVQMIREIADQILEKVKVSVTPETTSLEIVLTPEELGKVNLTVSAEQDGTMKAKFVTENELAKEAIERNLVQFKEMLQEQGLKVDTIEVTVGNFEFDRNGQAGDGSQEEKKNSSRGFMTEEEISQKDDTDQLAKVFMEGGESTVNYMA